MKIPITIIADIPEPDATAIIDAAHGVRICPNDGCAIFQGWDKLFYEAGKPHTPHTCKEMNYSKK